MCSNSLPNPTLSGKESAMVSFFVNNASYGFMLAFCEHVNRQELKLDHKYVCHNCKLLTVEVLQSHSFILNKNLV